MSHGLLSPAQRTVVQSYVRRCIVHDLGAGDMDLARELLVLGAVQVVAVDKFLNARKRTKNITCVETYFHNYKEAISTAFVSWPVNYEVTGLSSLLARASTVIYLGKNTDNTACGNPMLFEGMLTRELLAYVPESRNTLIICGAELPKSQGPRSPEGEELAGIDQSHIYEFEEAEAAACARKKGESQIVRPPFPPLNPLLPF